MLNIKFHGSISPNIMSLGGSKFILNYEEYLNKRIYEVSVTFLENEEFGDLP